MQMANRIAIVVTTFAKLRENALLVFHFFTCLENQLSIFFEKYIVNFIDSCPKDKFSLLGYFIDTTITGFSSFFVQNMKS